MATNKKRRTTFPSPDYAELRKNFRNRVTKKNGNNKKTKKDGKNKKASDEEELEDVYAIKNRLLDKIDTAEVATAQPVININEIEVDETVPRKRETTSYNPAEREMWTNPIKFEDLDLHVSHLDDSPTPEEVEFARYRADLEATARNYPESTEEEEGGEGDQDTEEANKTESIHEPVQRKRWINKVQQSTISRTPHRIGTIMSQISTHCTSYLLPNFNG